MGSGAFDKGVAVGDLHLALIALATPALHANQVEADAVAAAGIGQAALQSGGVAVLRGKAFGPNQEAEALGQLLLPFQPGGRAMRAFLAGLQFVTQLLITQANFDQAAFERCKSQPPLHTADATTGAVLRHRYPLGARGKAEIKGLFEPAGGKNDLLAVAQPEAGIDQQFFLVVTAIGENADCGLVAEHAGQRDTEADASLFAVFWGNRKLDAIKVPLGTDASRAGDDADADIAYRGAEFRKSGIVGGKTARRARCLMRRPARGEPW